MNVPVRILCGCVVAFANIASYAAPFAYITDGDNSSNSVSVMDTATNLVTATVPVGVRPYGVAVSPSGAAVYVTNADGGSVSVINASLNAVVATIPLGVGPDGIAVNPTRPALYVTDNLGNSMYVVSTVTT